MTAFEYVIVLLSIVLGLGIAQIVSGVADLVHQYERSTVYWPQLLWVVIVFILHVQEWWSTYELKSRASFALPAFLFILLYPINLFILARVLFPIVEAGDNYDVRKFYHASYRKIFLVAACLPFIASLNNLIILDRPVWTQIGHVAIIVIFVVLFTRRQIPEVVHKALAVVLLTSMLAVLGFMWNDLLY